MAAGLRCSLLLLPAVCGCAWTAPLDPDAPAPLNGVAGQVVLLDGAPPSNTFVFLYAAADPPPPAGTGRPLDFAAIPAAAYTGAGAGAQAAPFAITEVPDGDYLITALVDVDGDFNPLAAATTGASCGDHAGGHVGFVDDGAGGGALATAPVSLAGGALLREVVVPVSLTFSLERPAAVLTGAADGAARVPRAGGRFGLDSTAVRSPLVELGPVLDPAAPAACSVAFPLVVALADTGAAAARSAADTGAPTDSGGLDGGADSGGVDGGADSGGLDGGSDGGGGGGAAPSIDPLGGWPRVYLQLVSPDAGPLQPGEAWRSQAIVDPTAAIGAGAVVPGAATPGFVTHLDLVFPGVAVHTLPDGSEETVTDPAQIPAGAWSVTVVSLTGQTWTLPNETAALDSLGADFVAPLQGVSLRIE